MLYRIRLDLAFDAEDVAQAIFDKVKQVLPKAVKIANKDNPKGELSFIDIEKCYHDETPTQKCEPIERVEL